MGERPLIGEFAAALGRSLPDASAPARFARLLAEVIPDWRVEVPEEDAADLHFTAVAPDASWRSVSVTADWPTVDGYRDIDEWRVTGHGDHLVAAEMKLCHDAGPAEFEIVLRLLRATWAAAKMSGPDQSGPA